MNKFFTFVAAASLAMSASAQEASWWKAPTANVEAGTVLVDDAALKATTVFDATVKKSATTINEVEFTHYMQVRVKDAPSADNPTGTDNGGSTPVVLKTADNSVEITVYYRRQPQSDEYVAGDGKDLKINNTADNSVVPGVLEMYSYTDDGKYGFGTQTWTLDANTEYVLWAKGTTINFYGFSYEAVGGNNDEETYTKEQLAAIYAEFKDIIDEQFDDILAQVKESTNPGLWNTEAGKALEEKFNTEIMGAAYAILDAAEIEAYEKQEIIEPDFDELNETVFEAWTMEVAMADEAFMDEMMGYMLEEAANLIELRDYIYALMNGEIEEIEFPGFGKAHEEELEALEGKVQALYSGLENSYDNALLTGEYVGYSQEEYMNIAGKIMELAGKFAEEYEAIEAASAADLMAVNEIATPLNDVFDDETLSEEVLEKCANLIFQGFGYMEAINEAKNEAINETGVYVSPLTEEELAAYASEVENFIKTTGIAAISVSSEAVYFDLNGKRVAHPENGKVYVKVANGAAVKVIK